MSSSPSRSTAESDAGEEEKCVVGWIEVPPEPSGPISPKGKEPERKPEYQLVALTYSGNWYRLSLPSSNSNAASPPKPSTPRNRTSPISVPRPINAKGKEKEQEHELDKERHLNRQCTLEEYRKFGRWDGWG